MTGGHKCILIIHGNDIQIILYAATIQTGFNNAATGRMEIWCEIFRQFSSEEIIQHFSSCVITGFLHQWLLVYLQEAGRYFSPFNGQVIQFKTQQRTACILKLVAA